MKRGYLIAGNWKMYGSSCMATELLEAFKAHMVDTTAENAAEMVVFPPFVFLEQVKQSLTGTKIRWGAQNVAAAEQGAYTGEVSAGMLAEFGCQYVLVGHSERRSLFGESDADTVKKVLLAQQAGLTPILCVGETLEEREQGRTLEVVGRQLQVVLDAMAGEIPPNPPFAKGGIGQGWGEGQEQGDNTQRQGDTTQRQGDTSNIPPLQKGGRGDFVLAYEPVWAIGTGLTASPEQAQTVHAALRKQAAEHSKALAEQLCILYGGSVKKASAQALFAMPDIDGGLVGGASLDAQEFLQIYNSVCNNYS